MSKPIKENNVSTNNGSINISNTYINQKVIHNSKVITNPDFILLMNNYLKLKDWLISILVWLQMRKIGEKYIHKLGSIYIKNLVLHHII